MYGGHIVSFDETLSGRPGWPHCCFMNYPTRPSQPCRYNGDLRAGSADTTAQLLQQILPSRQNARGDKSEVNVPRQAVDTLVVHVNSTVVGGWSTSAMKAPRLMSPSGLSFTKMVKARSFRCIPETNRCGNE